MAKNLQDLLNGLIVAAIEKKTYTAEELASEPSEPVETAIVYLESMVCEDLIALTLEMPYDKLEEYNIKVTKLSSQAV